MDSLPLSSVEVVALFLLMPSLFFSALWLTTFCPLFLDLLPWLPCVVVGTWVPDVVEGAWVPGLMVVDLEDKLVTGLAMTLAGEATAPDNLTGGAGRMGVGGI